MDWKKYFEPQILVLGMDYYKSGLVMNYDRDEDSIQATVCGRYDYEVFLSLEDGEIADMQCTCPYSDRGNRCKHMAAVLFYMEDLNEDTEKAASTPSPNSQEGVGEPDKEPGIKQLVEEADPAVLQAFLIKMLINDEKLQVRFRSVLSRKISRKDMEWYKKRVEDIFCEYWNVGGYISYYDEQPFFNKFRKYLKKDIGGLVKNGHLEEAFELMEYIWGIIGEMDSEDTDDIWQSVMDELTKAWKSMLDTCDLTFKRFLFRWFMDQVDIVPQDYMKICMTDLVFSDFSEKEFLTEKFAYLQDKLEDGGEEFEGWDWGYSLGEWYLRRIIVMEGLDMPKQQIEEQIRENMVFSEVRNYYVMQCMERKNYEDAIQALEEGKAERTKGTAIYRDYSLKLKDLYKLTGRQNDYEKELWSLMLERQYENGEIYRELKSLYTEAEWREKRESIFSSLEPCRDVESYYVEDKLYDRLLKCVLDDDGLSKLSAYESCLMKLYPEELLDKYEAELKKEAERSSCREHYRELVLYLKRMQKYPGGEERAERIVEEWRKIYRRRPALMEELERV